MMGYEKRQILVKYLNDVIVWYFMEYLDYKKKKLIFKDKMSD